MDTKFKCVMSCHVGNTGGLKETGSAEMKLTIQLMYFANNEVGWEHASKAELVHFHIRI